MRILTILILFNCITVKADTTIKLGTFSLATEAGWGSAIELKRDGKAIITPSYDHEGSEKSKPKPKTIQGSWKKTLEGIEISYAEFKDRLKLEPTCKDWNDYPCFRYEKSAVGVKKKSPLDFNYPYINWDWKNN